ncbi:alpha/beta hydrolase [Pseudomonas sp. FP1911]|jgi:pimeloyl-ACP methyl ester carboxylesterase|uniref:Alpha/beta hydrolase n=1 Tax=Pseudomonas sp. W17 TaxID=3144407 RepID=A0AAU7X252_9PSED|nr:MULTISPECIES: alpha/beta hydrolase [Pseudomonas]WLG76703.1 alpha/beta hydrolase [Pseudomonas simiae]WLG82085.1 alpha/beta hydrolase [Pseudomonas sp. FP1911]WLH21133.1 alpha/beta hydrolase [Pseudomonas simiae]WLI32046.1 alpha/beta hydrolase [Pseudomonas rhodesiae]
MKNDETEYQKSWFTTKTGLKLFYRDYTSKGSEIPVICLHGFMRNSRDFEDLAPHLSTGRRVIAPDLRGRGRSDRATDAEGYHFDLLIQDTWELLDHLEIKRVVIIGTTLGGLMAIEMAGQNPERVAGIVVNDIGAEVPLAALKRMASHAENADYSFDEAVARVKEHNEAIYPGLEQSEWSRLMLRAYHETTTGRYERDFDLLTMRESARMQAKRPEFWLEFAKASAVPAALIRGELSDLLTADIATRMLAVNASATLTSVSDRGHPPLLDEPQSLTAITDLLQRASKKV